MNDKIAMILSQMTLEEKTNLCVSLGFWNLKPAERLGMPSTLVTYRLDNLRKRVPRSKI